MKTILDEFKNQKEKINIPIKNGKLKNNFIFIIIFFILIFITSFIFTINSDCRSSESIESIENLCLVESNSVSYKILEITKIRENLFNDSVVNSINFIKMSEDDKDFKKNSQMISSLKEFDKTSAEYLEVLKIMEAWAEIDAESLKIRQNRIREKVVHPRNWITFEYADVSYEEAFVWSICKIFQSLNININIFKETKFISSPNKFSYSEWILLDKNKKEKLEKDSYNNCLMKNKL